MPRPTWTPASDEQRAALAKLDEVAAKVQANTQELWETIEAARALGIAKERIAESASGAVSRATLYRRLGKTRPDSNEGASTS